MCSYTYMVVLHRINCVSCVQGPRRVRMRAAVSTHTRTHKHTHARGHTSIDRPFATGLHENPDVHSIEPIILHQSAYYPVCLCGSGCVRVCCRPVWTASEHRELKYYIATRGVCCIYSPYRFYTKHTHRHTDKSISLMDGLSMSVVAMQHRIQADRDYASHSHMRFTPFTGDGLCP